MEIQDSAPGVFTRKRLLTVALALMTLLSVYLCYLMVEPFIPALAFALALAVATARPFEWLKQRFQRDSIAAAIAVTLVTLVIVVPIALLGVYIVQEGVDNIRELQAGGGSWRNVIARQPQLQQLLNLAAQRFDVEAQIRRLGENIVDRATQVFGGSVAVVTQLVITLFVLFFLYRDGRSALRVLRQALPLSQSETDRMFYRVTRTIRATVNGSLTVALVQAIASGVMYTALRVPGAALWSAATFIVALIPVFGTFLVWGPITVYLLLLGSWTKAAILASWGVLAVGTIDNLLYPFLVGDKLRLHTVPTFFSILGGIGLFGPVGLILGPLVLAVTLGLLEVWKERTTDGQSADETAGEASPS